MPSVGVKLYEQIRDAGSAFGVTVSDAADGGGLCTANAPDAGPRWTATSRERSPANSPRKAPASRTTAARNSSRSRRPWRATRSSFRAASSVCLARALSRCRSSSAMRLIQSATATLVLMRHDALDGRCATVLNGTHPVSDATPHETLTSNPNSAIITGIRCTEGNELQTSTMMRDGVAVAGFWVCATSLRRSRSWPCSSSAHPHQRRCRSMYASVDRYHHRASIAFRRSQARITSGSRVIGTHKAAAIGGTTATGRGRRTRMRIGCHPITRAGATTLAGGKVGAATSSTITGGTVMIDAMSAAMHVAGAGAAADDASRAGPRRAPEWFRLTSESYRDQARSNRSRFMTLCHAATKSRTNFSFASSHA